MGALSQLVSAGAVKEQGRLRHRGAVTNTGRPARSGFKQTACPDTGRQHKEPAANDGRPARRPCKFCQQAGAVGGGYVPGKPRQTPAGQPGERSSQRAHLDTAIPPWLCRRIEKRGYLHGKTASLDPSSAQRLDAADLLAFSATAPPHKLWLGEIPASSLRRSEHESAHRILDTDCLEFDVQLTCQRQTQNAISHLCLQAQAVLQHTTQRNVEETAPDRHHIVAESCRQSSATAAVKNTTHFVLLSTRCRKRGTRMLNSCSRETVLLYTTALCKNHAFRSSLKQW